MGDDTIQADMEGKDFFKRDNESIPRDIIELSKRFDAVANDFFKFIKDNKLEKTEVKMFVPDDNRNVFKSLCRTPACHGGWAAIMYGVERGKNLGVHFYNVGSKLLAQKLGFPSSHQLCFWAEDNPKYWGNRNGGAMFCAKGAFGKKADERLSLTDIAVWYQNVAKRLRGEEVE